MAQIQNIENLPDGWANTLTERVIQLQERWLLDSIPSKPMPNTWHVPFRLSWRLRARYWLSDFWRYRVMREPCPVNWQQIRVIDWGLSEFEPPAIDSGAWTGRH